jgi:YfiH family protein
MQSIFRDDDGVVFGFSQKKHGDMKIWPGEGNVQPSSNRSLFFASQGVNVDKVVSALVVHQDKVFVVKEFGGYHVCDHDALVSNVPGLVLAITAADCPPISFYDPIKKVVAMAHSGWRSTVLNVAAKTIKKMATEYGSDPANIQSFIGPHIRHCHFIVGSEVAQKFPSLQVEKRGRELYVSLAGTITMQLIEAGLPMENMFESKVCTFCDDKLFSHRRDQYPRVQAGISYLGLKS